MCSHVLSGVLRLLLWRDCVLLGHSIHCIAALLIEWTPNSGAAVPRLRAATEGPCGPCPEQPPACSWALAAA